LTLFDPLLPVAHPRSINPTTPDTKALKIYRDLLTWPDPDPTYHTYAAACLFYMGCYAEAEEAVQQGPHSQLQVGRAWVQGWGLGGSCFAHAWT